MNRMTAIEPFAICFGLRVTLSTMLQTFFEISITPYQRTKIEKESKFDHIRGGLPVNIDDDVTTEMSDLIDGLREVIKANRNLSFTSSAGYILIQL